MKSSPAENQAVAQAQQQSGAATQPYLTFALGPDSYAAGIHAIREILEVPPLTVVPLVPGIVRGVMNLRGAVVPVVDLAARFDLAPTQLARRTCVVVVEMDTGEGGSAARQPLGILVDAVHEVQDVAPDQVEPTPGLGTRIRPEFLSGMLRLNGQLLGVLDLPRVLAQQELARLVAGHPPR
jgi:purine-binding chemotaxis protein CheW